MRVGIDICRLTDPWTGIGNYIHNLLCGLAEVDRETSYLLYPFFWECFPRDFKALDRFVPRQANFSLFARDRPELWVKLVWCKLRLRHERFLGRVDVTHSTNLAAARLNRSKLAVTVHDLSFVRRPQWHKKENTEFSRRSLENALRHADAIITPSEFTAGELVDLYPRAAGRVRAAPEAVMPQFRPDRNPAALAAVRRKYGLERPYFLFVGSLEPRKNLVRLAEAFARLREAGYRDFDLAAAGGVGWEADEIIEALDHPRTAGHVHRLGYAPGPDLPLLYQGAHAVVYPSLYEGFGLPVLEGMACGTPVIASRAGSIPEVGGEAVLYVDPEDTDQIVEAMARIIEDRDLHAELAARGPERARLFSRAEMGRRTLAVYRELAG
jgi:glycosyltransferase involved in cell wall biosynthesis